MKKIEKSSIIISIVLISLLCIGAVSAADDVATDDAAVADADNVQTIEDYNVENNDISYVTSDVAEDNPPTEDLTVDDANSKANAKALGDDTVKTFTDLKDAIDNPVDGVVTLEGTYIYDDEADAALGVNGIILQTPLTINGPATLDGNGQTRIFQIGGEVTLNGLTFINGYAGYGGALRALGTNPIVINDCVFRSNNVISSAYGGAIYNTATDLTITGCTFEDNVAMDPDSWAGYGGAIFTGGSAGMTLKDSIFKRNSAGWGSSGIYWGSSNGLISNCLFEDMGSSYDYYAVLYISGSGNTIEYCNFTSNTATEWGGAVFNAYSDKNTFKYCNFIGNMAETGGAIYSYDSTNLVIDNCLFDSNEATGDGGAVYLNYYYNNGPVQCNDKITSSVFINNQAVNGGSSIRNDAFGTTVKDCIILDPPTSGQKKAAVSNEANGAIDYNWWGHTTDNATVQIYQDDPYFDQPDYWYVLDLEALDVLSAYNVVASIDKVLYTYDNNFVNHEEGCKLPDVTFNVAATAGTCSDTVDLQNGVGNILYQLYDPDEGTLTVEYMGITKSITLQGLEQLNLGPFGILQERINRANSGDTIDILEDVVFDPVLDADLINGIVIDKPITIAGHSFTIDGADSARIFNVVSPGELTLNDVTISNGNAKDGAGIYVDSGARLTATDTKFIDNTATYSGGAIYADNAEISISNSVFDGNDVTDLTKNNDTGGAAIHGNLATLTLVNTNVTNNGNRELDRTKGDLINGVINLMDSDAYVTDCVFENNTGIYGGAITTQATSEKELKISGSNFTSNYAYTGGALYVGSDVKFTIEDSIFDANNKATGEGSPGYTSGGGAIQIMGAEGTFDNITVTNCIATQGGAIGLQGANVEITGSTFTDNAATAIGGAIFANSDVVLKITDSTFSGNTAQEGTHICNRGDLTLEGNTFDTLSYGIETVVVEEDDYTYASKVPVTGTIEWGVSGYTIDVSFTLTKDGEVINYVPKLENFETGDYSIELTDLAPGFYTIELESFTDENGNKYIVNGASDSFTLLPRGPFGTIQEMINNASEGDTIVLRDDYVFDPVLDRDYVNGIVIDKPITIAGHLFTVDGAGLARIFNITSADVTLKDFILQNGKAEEGAAIYVTSDDSALSNLIVDGCTFRNNVANYGAGIYTKSDFTVLNSVFDSNDISDKTTYNGGAAIQAMGATIVIENSKITNNAKDIIIRGLPDQSLISAAVNLVDCDAIIKDTLFENNSGCYGGAISSVGKTKVSSLNVDDCTFIDNLAYNGAGIDITSTIFNIKDTYFKGNDVKGNGSSGTLNSCGGAIAIGGDGTEGIINNCTFEENTAEYVGGAIVTSSDTPEGSVVINNSVFIKNQVTNDFSANKNKGGAIYIAHKGAMIANSTFKENYAKYEGGAICTDANDPTVDTCIFEDNEAVYSGGAIYFNLLYCTVNNSEFYSNEVTGGSGGAIGVYLGRPVTIENSTFIENKASSMGGAISSGSLTIINSSFDSNEAGSHGGAVAFSNPSNFTECNFTSNVAGSDGGAIRGTNPTVISNSRFNDNIATGNGGAIRVSSKATISDSNFTANKASASGGAISTTSNLTVNNGIFNENSATLGGAIHNTKIMSISGSQFTDNTCDENSHAIFSSGTLSLEGNTVSNVIYNKGNITTPTYIVVLENKTKYIQSVPVTIDAVILDDNNNKITGFDDYALTVKIDSVGYEAIATLSDDYVYKASFTPENPGTFLVTAEYAGIDGLKQNTLKTGELQEADLTLSADIKDIEYPENAIIEVTLKDGENGLTGIVIVTINETDYPVAVVNGEGSLAVSGLNAGTYDYTALYAVEGNDPVMQDQKSFVVNPKPVSIDFDNIGGVDFGGKGECEVTLYDLDTGDRIKETVELIFTDDNGVELARVNITTHMGPWDRMEEGFDFTQDWPIGNYHVTVVNPNYVFMDVDDFKFNFVSYGDEEGNIQYGTGTAEQIGEDPEDGYFPVEVLTNDIDDSFVGQTFYIQENADPDGTTLYQLYTRIDVGEGEYDYVETGIWVSVSNAEPTVIDPATFDYPVHKVNLDVEVVSGEGKYIYRDEHEIELELRYDEGLIEVTAPASVVILTFDGDLDDWVEVGEPIAIQFVDGKATISSDYLSPLQPGEYRLKVTLDDDTYQLSMWDDDREIDLDYCLLWYDDNLFWIDDDHVYIDNVEGIFNGRYPHERTISFELWHRHYDDSIDDDVESLFEYSTIANVTIYFMEWDDDLGEDVLIPIFDAENNGTVDITNGISESIPLNYLPAGNYKVTISLIDDIYTIEGWDDQYGHEADYQAEFFNIEEDNTYVRVTDGTQWTRYGQERELTFELWHYDDNARDDVLFVYDTQAIVTLYKWNDESQEFEECGEPYAVDIKDGLSEALDLSSLNAGNYKVTVKLVDDIYSFNEWDDGQQVDYKSEWFNVDKADVDFKVGSIVGSEILDDVIHDITFGDDFTFTINITGVNGETLNETVHVWIEDCDFDREIELVNGYNSTTIPDEFTGYLTTGHHNLFIDFDGTENYNGVYGNHYEVIVHKATPSIAVVPEGDVNYGDSPKIDISLTGIDGGIEGETLIVKVYDSENNEYYGVVVTDENGNATFTPNAVFAPGGCGVEVKFLGNDDYEGYTNYTASFYVAPADININSYNENSFTYPNVVDITVNVDGLQAGDTIGVTLTVLDSKGEKAFTGSYDVSNGYVISVPGLPVDSYTYTISFAGDNKYNAYDSKEEAFEVLDVDQVVVPASANETIPYGEDLTVEIGPVSSEGNLPVTGKATINVYAGDDTTAEPVKTVPDIVVSADGAAPTIIGGLAAGSYSIVVDFTSEDGFYNGQATAYTTVIKADLTIDPQVSSPSVYGKEIEVTFTLPKGVNGTLTATIDGNAIDVEKLRSVDNYVISCGDDLTPGTHTVVVKLTGDSNYDDAVGTVSFDVAKATPTIAVTGDTKEYGETATVKVTVSGDGLPLDGRVIVTVDWGVDGLTQVVDLVEGSGEAGFNLSPYVADGTYDITATYLGDGNYGEAVNNTEKVIIKPSTVALIDVTAPEDAPAYGDNVIIGVSVVDESGAALPVSKVNVSVNGKTKEYSVDNDGNVNLGKLSAGENEIEVIFNDGVHTEARETINVNVAPSDDVTLRIEQVETAPSEDAKVKVTVLDSVTEKPLNGTITVSVDGEPIGQMGYKLDKNGTAVVPIPGLDAGDHFVEVKFVNPDYAQTTNSAIINVPKGTPVVSVIGDTVEYGDSATVKVTVSGDGLPLDGRVIVTVDWGVDGLTQVVDLVEGSGEAGFNLSPYVADGTYDITATYLGNDNFEEAVNATEKVTITPSTDAAVEITAPAETPEYGDNVTIGVAVKDGSGAQLPVSKVNVTVNGKTKAYAVDNDGNVNLGKLPAGENEITVTFNDGVHKVTSEDVKITVDPNDNANMDMTISPEEAKYGDTVTASITVTDENNKAISGKVCLTVDGDLVDYADLKSGKAKFEIKDLAVGDHNIAIYLINSNYTDDTFAAETITVAKGTPIVNVTGATVDYGKPATVKVTVKDGSTNVDGYAVVTVNGVDYSVKIAKGAGSVTITGLDSGNYPITAKFLGNDNYTAADYAGAAKVVVKESKELNIEVIPNEVVYGEDATIAVKVTDVNGKPVAVDKVNVTVNGDTKEYPVEDGVVTIPADELNVADNPIAVSFNDGVHDVATADSIIDVDPKDTAAVTVGTDDKGIAIEAKDGTAPLSGTASVSIDGATPVEVPVGADGKASVPIDDLAPGKHTVEVTFANDNYEPVTEVATITVPKGTVTINVTGVEITEGEDAIVDITVKDGSTGVDGGAVVDVKGAAYFVNLTEGEGKVIIADLPAGKYDINAFFLGNDNYEAADYTGTAQVVVNKAPEPPVTDVPTTVNVTVKDIKYGEDETITFNVAAGDGTPITGNLTVTIGDTNKTVPVSNGKGSLKLTNLTAGTYPVVANYAGNGTYAPSIGTAYFNVTKNATWIDFENMTTHAVDLKNEGRVGEWFYFTLRDANGKPIANTPMQIGFNGKVYTYEDDGVCTDENGTARLQINLGYKGDYTFAICFLGDDNYNASFAVAKIHVDVQKPTLTVPAQSYKASAKTKTLTATFTSAHGDKIAKQSIKFTVNGKTYSAKTDDKGVAKVNVSLTKKGTYVVKAQYGGTSTYDAVSKNAVLKIT